MVQDERGYLPAVIGAVLGMTIGGVLFGCAGYAYFAYELRDDPRGLPGWGAIIVGVPAAQIGQVLGCWLVLRWAEFERAGATAVLLIPIAIGGAIVTSWIVVRTDDLGGAFLFLLFWPFVAPALARAIVVRVGPP